MTTVPALNIIQNLAPTDTIMITHADGSTERFSASMIIPTDQVATNNMQSVTSNGVYNALRPVASTVNSYIEKGDDVASVDTGNTTGYRLNKISINQYHMHLEPARFTAKADPQAGYFEVFKFGNALLQAYSESKNIIFSTEALLAIWDETNGTYAVVLCFVGTSTKSLYVRNAFPFNQNFNFIEGHSYTLIGDITFCVT